MLSIVGIFGCAKVLLFSLGSGWRERGGVMKFAGIFLGIRKFVGVFWGLKSGLQQAKVRVPPSPGKGPILNIMMMLYIIINIIN